MIQVQLGENQFEVDDQYKDQLQKIAFDPNLKFLCELLEERAAYHTGELMQLIDCHNPAKFAELVDRRAYAKALQDVSGFLHDLGKQIKDNT